MQQIYVSTENERFYKLNARSLNSIQKRSCIRPLDALLANKSYQQHQMV